MEHNPLTSLEQSALRQLAFEGRTAHQAAEALGISYRTIQRLLYGARAKLNARTNTEAAIKAAMAKLIVLLPLAVSGMSRIWLLCS